MAFKIRKFGFRVQYRPASSRMMQRVTLVSQRKLTGARIGSGLVPGAVNSNLSVKLSRNGAK